MKTDDKILSKPAEHWLDSSAGIATYLGIYSNGNGER